MADARAIGSVLTKAGAALASVGPAVLAVNAPVGAAATILGALAMAAGEVLQGADAPVVHAADPGEQLDAMKARIAARWAASQKGADRR